MATYQTYQSQASNKGTLIPGQLLTVNKYAVQVERYLAQGGFAHVYLVTTATPVYNTTRHVLKRIAVANEAMLAEVKKEVDIMRILKGHPNIVHLIDAAWHRMPNGFYEVFILMEFCPGGGLIDMMNRRLRERLTESEILQIFVDVCEGVAAMHNLRPPLLHRDLKVENILQSTPSSFKLCDFGSATSVASRPPSTTQEIRALEADLNRHTTLQYRAPEMVDPYLRRPVDEKSDVWALGVLLYKLCYYTTPFEEHGPLAILNVQYRIPPYPVYSAQMNTLIASILREHSAQRPSVFELLFTVHDMRGTKSLFHYPAPTAPSLPPRQPQVATQAGSQKKLRRQPSGSSANTSPSKKLANAGIQAREKVLEAIAPMRRGRPNSSKEPPSRSRSRPGSPQKPSHADPLAIPSADIGRRPDWLDGSFSAEDEKAWQNVINMKVDASGQAKPNQSVWAVKSSDAISKDAVTTIQAFDDDFQTKIWDSLSPTSPPGISSNSLKPTTTKYRPPAFTGNETARSTTTSITKIRVKDAFGDLGLSNRVRPPAPTLGEARRLRTGLATMTIQGQKSAGDADQNKSSPLSNRPTPSPKPTYLLPSPSQFQSSSKSHSPSPSLLSSSWKPLNQPLPSDRDSSSLPDGLPVESRFPSLEELDASFAKQHVPDISGEPKRQPPDTLLQPSLPSRSKIVDSGIASPSRPPSSYNRKLSDGKSAQSTGLVTRDIGANKTTTQEQLSRPPLRRKHRSTHSFKVTTTQTNVGDSDKRLLALDSKLELPGLGFSTSQSSPRFEQKDWLTGDDNQLSSHSSSIRPSTLTPSNPLLPSSPGPGISSIEKSPRQAPQEPTQAQPNPSLASSQIPSATTRTTTTSTTSRNSRIFPPTVKSEATDQSNVLSGRWSPDKSPDQSSDSRLLGLNAVKTTAQLPEPSNNLKAAQTPTHRSTRILEKDSSSDDEPEDTNGYIPSVAKAQEIKHARRSHKGRQSSVHDLVDLWGGSAVASSSSSGTSFNADATSGKRVASLSASIQTSTKPTPRSTSPQPIVSAPPDHRGTSRPQKLPNLDAERHNNQPLSAGSTRSPISARSRPQSMFLFPVSRSNSDGMSPTSPSLTSGVASASLMPPDEPKPRRSRRTSISDMVQMYEAIGGRANVSGPSAVLSKSVGVRPHTRDNSNFTRTPPLMYLVPSKQNEDPDLRAGPSLSLPSGLQNNLDLSKSRTSPTRSPNSAFHTSAVGRRDVGRSNEPEKVPPPPKLHSIQPPSTTDKFSSELLNAKLTSRKPDASTEETTKPEERSSSPDHSYQGVGKLIAQWQRKSEEADSVKPPMSPRRGGPVGKRTLLVSGTDKGR